MSVTINTSGIIFRYKDAKKGLIPIKRVLMNPGVQKDLEAACKELAGWGYIYIDTLGIVCNRPQRRNSKTTSKHSTGLMYAYKAWRDGTNGSRAFDLIAMVHSSAHKSKCKYLFIEKDRIWICQFWRKHNFKLYHTGDVGDPKWTPDHIHVER